MKKQQENDIVQHFFPDNPLLFDCISWTCRVPQDNSSPLHGAAVYVYKEVVEVLLRNGVKVNALMEVIFAKKRAYLGTCMSGYWK